MKNWLASLHDHPGVSCVSCRDIRVMEGVAPECVAGRCPVVAPGGVAGLVAMLWADLRALPSVHGWAGLVVEGYRIRPDRTLVSLVRFLESSALEIFKTKPERMEIRV